MSYNLSQLIVDLAILKVKHGDNPPPAGGNVVGPQGATDGNIAVYDGSSGLVIKDGGPTNEILPVGYNFGFEISGGEQNIVHISPGAALDDTKKHAIISTTDIDLNFEINGINGLDVGALAANSTYYIFVIAGGDLPVASVASLSLNNPVLPAGYTRKTLYQGRAQTLTGAFLSRVINDRNFMDSDNPRYTGELNGEDANFRGNVNALIITAVTFDGIATSSLKWEKPVLLAGNNVDGSTDVKFSNKFIMRGTSDDGLTGAQFLGNLTTGLLKVTTGTGNLSTATSADFTPLLDSIYVHRSGGETIDGPKKFSSQITGVITTALNANRATYADSSVKIVAYSSDPTAGVSLIPFILNDGQEEKQIFYNEAFNYDPATNLLIARLVPSNPVNNNILSSDENGLVKDTGISFTTSFTANDNTTVMVSGAAQLAITSNIKNSFYSENTFDVNSTTEIVVALGGQKNISGNYTLQLSSFDDKILIVIFQTTVNYSNYPNSDKLLVTSVSDSTGLINIDNLDQYLFFSKIHKINDPNSYVGLTVRMQNGTIWGESTLKCAITCYGEPFKQDNDVLKNCIANTLDYLNTIAQSDGGLSVYFNTPNTQKPTYLTLTDSANISLNLAFRNFRITLGGNRTLGVPYNIVEGQAGVINVRQDAIGNRTLLYSWPYEFAGGAAPVLSTAKYQFDQLYYNVNHYFTSEVIISIGAPAVFTVNVYTLVSGHKIQFTTTGALPTGLSPNTTYWVKVLTYNTFNVATSLVNLQAGNYVTTSGSQSGVHTALSISVTVSVNLGVS